MDGIPPDLHAYLSPSPPTMACVSAEASHYGIPVPVALAIMKTEGGRPGAEVSNTNNTRDLGVMQINEIHIPNYAKKTGLSEPLVRHLLVQNGCFSVSVAMDILSSHLRRTGSLVSAVAAYHSRTPHIGSRYVMRIEKNLQRLQAGQLPVALAK